ncbi:MAG: hypothetical protein KDB53_20905, partial [Planctomycetes bacterium]|nr:hypothetical protein [Planctomycetota bacterium]
PNQFANAGANEVHFLEFQFNGNVDATTVLTGTFSGQDGIEVRDQMGALVPIFLDSTGALAASNQFPSAGVAPSLLRIYFQAAGQPAGTPRALPNDSSFVINVFASRLRSETGGSLCLLTGANGCTNPVEVTYGFGTGTDSTPLAQAANPTVPLLNATIPIDQEIRLFFNDNVDFRSIVGVNPNTGNVNVTQRDPYISVPFPVNNVMMGATSLGENLQVTYTPPAMVGIGPQYGFVLYQPDPFHNPTEVRIRFVDLTIVSGTDALPATQNYGLDNLVWTAAGLTPPTNNQGNLLSLPAKLPLPGSTASGTASLAITLFGMGNGLALDTSVTGDAVLGVTDRSRMPMMNDFVVNYTLQIGPMLANHPSPPDLHIVMNGNILDGISTAAIAGGGAAGPLQGTMFPIASPLQDQNTLGVIRDVAFGAFLNPANSLQNPPRRNNNAGAIFQGIDPGVPFPPGGTPENGLTGMPPAPPLGTRLYVTDDTGQLKTFDSTTFLPLGVVVGVPSAWGLGISPTDLFVSNFDQATIMKIGFIPAVVGTFHQIIDTIAVGNNPYEVSVNPDNEDVLVVNQGDSTFSVVEINGGFEQDNFSVGPGAEHLSVSGRMLGNPQNVTLAYQAFVTNTLGDSISIYESDSVNIMVQN